MSRSFSSLFIPGLLFSVLLIVSCGGGGGGNSDDQNPPTTVNDSNALRQMGLVFVGLGDEIKVTNTTQATIEGLAYSDGTISSITIVNETAGNTVKATGTDVWQASIDLVDGKNSITATLTNVDGSTYSISTVIVQNGDIDFTTPLQFDKSITYSSDPIGAAETIRVLIGSSNPNSPTINLLKLDSTGSPTGAIASMKDDGVLPDEIASDGIFTAEIVVNDLVSAAGFNCAHAQVDDITGASYFSESKCVFDTVHYTDEQISNVVTTADNVDNFFQTALNSQDATLETAAKSAYDNIKTSTAASGYDATGGVWWISHDGVLGVYHHEIENSKAGGRKQGLVAPTPVIKAPFYPEYYIDNKNLANYASKAIGSSNEVGSQKAVIISPYINHPNDPLNSFGQNDDFFSVWQTIANANSCGLVADSARVNNNSVGVTLDSFKLLSDFGYIHISTHGDSFFHGLFADWDDAWGPSNFLSGSFAVVGIYSGIGLPKNNDGSWDLTGYESDLKAHRLAFTTGGDLVVLPEFFRHYLSKLPNSIVALSACKSMYNNSMANVLLSKGAGVVYGYDDYVSTSYAQSTTNNIIVQMLSGSNFGAAYDDSIAKFGSDDNPSLFVDGADFLYVGNRDLKLGGGTFANGDFETGSLTPWTVSGDGRIIAQLGSESPVGGTYMGIVSTGLGYTTSSGSMSQLVCGSSGTNTLNFSWNFLSEEFLEFCNSQFDDFFTVDVCDSTGTSCSSVFSTSVNQICSSGPATTPHDSSFDQDDVHKTGWQLENIDISAHTGSGTNVIRFSTGDIGDSIYDTAVLIDNIELQ